MSGVGACETVLILVSTYLSYEHKIGIERRFVIDALPPSCIPTLSLYSPPAWFVNALNSNGITMICAWKHVTSHVNDQFLKKLILSHMNIYKYINKLAAHVNCNHTYRIILIDFIDTAMRNVCINKLRVWHQIQQLAWLWFFIHSQMAVKWIHYRNCDRFCVCVLR